MRKGFLEEHFLYCSWYYSVNASSCFQVHLEDVTFYTDESSSIHARCPKHLSQIVHSKVVLDPSPTPFSSSLLFIECKDASVDARWVSWSVSWNSECWIGFDISRVSTTSKMRKLSSYARRPPTSLKKDGNSLLAAICSAAGLHARRTWAKSVRS